MKLGFGECVLDLAARQLTRNGTEVPLEPKMYELLEVLIKARPAVLKLEALDEILWPKTYVARTSLTRLVSELRAVLGDDARESRIIRTVYKTGYAFDATVTELGAASRPNPADTATNSVVLATFGLIWNDRWLPLHEGSQVAGRGEECDLVIDAETVSRKHARFSVHDGTAMIEDLGSTNGTSVNGATITAPTVLLDGGDIALGAVKLKLKKRNPEKETLRITDAERDRLHGIFR